MLLLDNVSLQHGGTRRPGASFALGEISLAIPGGAFRWLIGPSGAGKSSLLHLLNLSQRPSAGRMEILGVDPARISRARRAVLRRRIGMVYQDYRLLGELTAIDNVALPLRLARAPEREAQRESRAIFSWLGLAGRENVRPEQLSGGERQRVAIARALIGRPDLVLADEPTNALDETQARRLVDLFQELARGGATVIVATHNEALLRDFPAPMIALQDRTAREIPPLTRSRTGDASAEKTRPTAPDAWDDHP